MKINEMIKQKRIEQKLTQEQVAKYLGVIGACCKQMGKRNFLPGYYPFASAGEIAAY